MGVIPHTVLTYPDSTHARVTHKFHGTVGHPCTRPQQQHRDARRRDLNDPFFVCNGDCAVLSAKGAVLQIQKGHPVFHLRQRLQVKDRIMPGISSISVSSAHNGHQSKAIGLAAPHALTQQCPELLCIGHLQNALIGHR